MSIEGLAGHLDRNDVVPGKFRSAQLAPVPQLQPACGLLCVFGLHGMLPPRRVEEPSIYELIPPVGSRPVHSENGRSGLSRPTAGPDPHWSSKSML
jgi:hypothetical protein